MELSEIIALGAGIVALVVAGLAYYRSGQPLTLQGLQNIVTDTSSLAAEVQQVAEVGVAAAQQLKDTGNIDSNEAAFQHAVKHVEGWYNSLAPDIHLDPHVVANAVESAYYWLKRAQNMNQPAALTSEAELVDRFLREGNAPRELPPGAR